MEQTVVAFTTKIAVRPPLPPPPPITKATLTRAQIATITKKIQEAIRLRDSKLPATLTQPRTPNSYRLLTTAPLTPSQKARIANNEAVAMVTRAKRQAVILASFEHPTYVQCMPSITINS